ncbi:MAG: glycosyltransferase family 39 protein [Bacteroidetes bacterium]|nr:glycosyltransferase family 39 protein [Bacteroidota bacterium]
MKKYTIIIFCFAAAKILLHLLNPEYGYHRDEMYYIAISDNFTFRNLDMLPLTPLYLKFIAAIFGYSLKAVHFASALCGALSLVFACLITKEFKGGHHAVFLTGLFGLFSGFIIFGGLFSYDSLEFLIITTALYILLRIFNEGKKELWIVFGIVMGLGLMNKLTILFFGFAVFLGLWLVPQRKLFKEKWIWLAGIIALAFLVPYLLWQSKNGWYFLDFAKTYAGGNSYIASLPEFFWNQLIGNNVINFPVWITGLFLLLFSKNWSQYRFFGFVYIILFLLFFSVGAKFYFLIPMYSILLSAGSVKLEGLFAVNEGSVKKRVLLKYVLPVFYVILSLPTAALAIPFLSVESFEKFSEYIGGDAGIKHSYARTRRLPQHFADRFGWEEMAMEISKVYESLPAYEKGKTGIITENWGEASAVNLYRNKYSLPEAICGDGWYYYETLRKKNFKEIYIAYGLRASDAAEVFNSVELKGIFKNEYCILNENNRRIFLCSLPKYDLYKYWTVLGRMDEKFSDLVNKGKIDTAIAYYYHNKKNDTSALMFTRRQVSTLGNELLSRNRIDEAIKLSIFNTEIFPSSSFAYYWLGEAYKKKGNLELAAVNYQKALNIDPESILAYERLMELRRE